MCSVANASAYIFDVLFVCHWWCRACLPPSFLQMFVTFPNWDEFVTKPMIRAGGNPHYVTMAFFALMLSQLLHTVRACDCA